MMACLKVLRLSFALPAIALGLCLPCSLPAQTQNIPAKTQVLQQKVPAGAQLKVPIQQVQVPLRLTITPSSYTPAVNDNLHIEATWNRLPSIVSYLLNWGDAPPSVEMEPRWDHAYQQPGHYKVMVTVKVLVNDREFDVRSNELIIRVQPAPQVELPLPSLTANPTSVRLGEEVTFTAGIDSRVGPAQYHFYFDDGTDLASDSNEITHPYRIPGTHHPYVVAVLGHGDAIVTSPAIDVTVLIPNLTVTLETTEPIVGKIVTVRAALDSPRTDVGYELDWDDDSTPENVGGGGLATHIYATARPFNVRVRASIKGAENYPAINTVTIVVNKGAQPLDWWLVAVMVVVVAAGAAIGWKIYQGSNGTKLPTGDLHVTGHPGDARHEISVSHRGVPYLSITLVPGSDPQQHRITFL